MNDQYYRQKLPVFLWETNWNNPEYSDFEDLASYADDIMLDPEHSRKLKDILDVDGNRDLGPEFFKNLYLDDDQALHDVVDFLKSIPPEVMEVREKRVYSFVMTVGGPTFMVDCEIDADGRLLGARARCSDGYGGWQENILPLPMAQAIWDSYSHVAEREEPANAPKKRQPRRMGIF